MSISQTLDEAREVLGVAVAATPEDIRSAFSTRYNELASMISAGYNADIRAKYEGERQRILAATRALGIEPLLETSDLPAVQQQFPGGSEPIIPAAERVGHIVREAHQAVQGGRAAEAKRLFEQALSVDPDNQAIREELRKAGAAVTRRRRVIVCGVIAPFIAWVGEIVAAYVWVTWDPLSDLFYATTASILAVIVGESMRRALTDVSQKLRGFIVAAWCVGWFARSGFESGWLGDVFACAVFGFLVLRVPGEEKHA